MAAPLTRCLTCRGRSDSLRSWLEENVSRGAPVARRPGYAYDRGGRRRSATVILALVVRESIIRNGSELGYCRMVAGALR